MPTRAKTFDYGVALGRDWTGRSDKGEPSLPHEEAWSPEHLVLAGLGRCTLTSLRYHAGRAGIEDASGATVSGVVGRRAEDGRFAFAEISVAIDATLDPAPADVRELISKSERDCFVGASLRVAPAYTWIVNGEEVR